MKTALPALATIAFIAFTGCDYLEARRVSGQIERELDIEFSSQPAVLQSESYGSIEENGDRSLLQLNPADCAQVSERLEEKAPTVFSGDASRLFALAGIAPVSVRRRTQRNGHGDIRVYELDEASCVLFRQAHFE